MTRVLIATHWLWCRSPGRRTVRPAYSRSQSVRFDTFRIPFFFGSDRFDYIVRDAAGATATARVTVTVNEGDDGTPPAGSNLVVNGYAESGLAGSAGAITTGGYATVVDLLTLIAGGRRFSFSVKSRATEINRRYAYLRVREGGVWRYQ
jgi:hypothetical protein